MCEQGKRYLPHSKECFVCGEENPAGLQSRFYIEEELVKMPLTVRADHCGYPGAVHGGVLAAALDECMGWAAALSIGRMCLTGELTVRYIDRAPVDESLTVVAEVLRSHRRMVHARGRIVNAAGKVFVQGDGRFLPLSVEQTLAVDDALLHPEDGVSPFAALREQGWEQVSIEEFWENKT